MQEKKSPVLSQNKWNFLKQVNKCSYKKKKKKDKCAWGNKLVNYLDEGNTFTIYKFQVTMMYILNILEC